MGSRSGTAANARKACRSHPCKDRTDKQRHTRNSHGSWSNQANWSARIVTRTHASQCACNTHAMCKIHKTYTRHTAQTMRQHSRGLMKGGGHGCSASADNFFRLPDNHVHWRWPSWPSWATWMPGQWRHVVWYRAKRHCQVGYVRLIDGSLCIRCNCVFSQSSGTVPVHVS
jgi:hypothetical protein